MTRDELLTAYKKGERNFRRAYLRGADLGGAYLRGAYLRGAYLRGADLGGADLGGADLGGADLGGAYLRGADLGKQWIVQGATSKQGYAWFLMNLLDGVNGALIGPRIRAGCHWFTFQEAIDYWRGSPKWNEMRLMIRHLIELARVRGYELGAEWDVEKLK